MGWFWLDVPLLAVLFTMWAAACRWPGRPSPGSARRERSRGLLDRRRPVSGHRGAAFVPRHTLHAEGVLLTVLLLLGVHVALRLMFAAGAPAPKVADTSAQVVASERPDR